MRDAMMMRARWAGRAGGPGRGPRARRAVPEPVATTAEELSAWFAGSLPDDWFTGPATVRFDRDEILVTGDLAAPKVAEGDPAEVARAARIEAFRESTREARIAIALRAEERFERKVSWAATCGDTAVAFTTASVPAMTRLGFEQRATLDTLIDAGVARSRSEALAWCVDLVAEHESTWIAELREALSAVQDARRKGPASR